MCPDPLKLSREHIIAVFKGLLLRGGRRGERMEREGNGRKVEGGKEGEEGRRAGEKCEV